MNTRDKSMWDKAHTMTDGQAEANAMSDPDKISWPPKYHWLHEYALTRPDAVLEYKETWDALLYRLHGKIFALLLRNRTDTLLNLKCDPYLALDFRARYANVLPGWHMNKLHWNSLRLKGNTPEDACRELVDISYDLVRQGLPKKLREGEQNQQRKVYVPALQKHLAARI